jgi:hypothetical protein
LLRAACRRLEIFHMPGVRARTVASGFGDSKTTSRKHGKGA